MQRSHFFFMLAMSIATPALAQQNVSMEVMVGTVLIDSEAGLVAANGQTVLKTGDRIFLKAGSAALLSNAESGCFVSLRTAGEYTVPEMTGCVAGQASVLPSNFEVIPANGFPAAPVAYASGPGFTPIAVGAAFVAATAGVALYTTVLQNEEKPVAVSIP
jgi:hypothetical protein